MALSKVTDLFRALDSKTVTCEHHGDYISRLMRIPGKDEPIWSGCDECQREQVRQEDRRMAEESKQQMEQQRISRILGRAAIPQRFLDRTFDNFTVENDGQRKAFSASKRYADDWRSNRKEGRCLIMVGDPGTGKTHLAIAIAREVMNQGGTAMFTRAHEAISTIMETYRRDSPKSERQVLDEFRKPDLLIIDEVGRQRGTDNERMMLFEIINRRYDDEKPTLLISNLNLEKLRGYIDEATEDRLRERGGRVIVFDWESWRTKV